MTVDVTGAETVRVHAHLQTYDALHAWEVYAGIDATRTVQGAGRVRTGTRRSSAGTSSRRRGRSSASYAPVYGFIRESAGRHGLAPEFLQTVVFGEGVGRSFELAIKNGDSFGPGDLVSAFGSLGLDLILYRVGGVGKDGDARPHRPRS